MEIKYVSIHIPWKLVLFTNAQLFVKLYVAHFWSYLKNQMNSVSIVKNVNPREMKGNDKIVMVEFHWEVPQLNHWLLDSVAASNTWKI